jgi:glycosyltransferase involved in cell wall biosynthesis
VQNKLLESMAAQCPIVCSPTAASGIDVTNGRELLIADDPEAFAGAVVRLLEDSAFAGRLAERAQARVVEQHGVEMIGARFAALAARYGGTGECAV